MKKISNLEKRAIICLYNNNFSIDDIASIFNIHYLKIYRLLKSEHLIPNKSNKK